VFGSFATQLIVRFGGTSLAHKLFMNMYVVGRSSPVVLKLRGRGKLRG
jgi:hypothetical protein